MKLEICVFNAYNDIKGGINENKGTNQIAGEKWMEI